ncbi:MAG: glucoamylase family protein [Proteiniphilum sp.]|nr:glucoamylase family protein [Proteiniphilum sp.]MDD3909539.1 glucoamylase family protein [Proteiniphilum sp.]MDD4415421.1 glucoamylase family protein [Proteiniphilum sp.]
MQKLFWRLPFLALTILFWTCSENGSKSAASTFELEIIEIDGIENSNQYVNINPELTVKLIFSDVVDPISLQKNIVLRKSGVDNIPLVYTIDNRTIQMKTEKELTPYTSYQLIINTGLKSVSGNLIVTAKIYMITTGINPADKFPRISDEELLTLVQKQTFNYFWDFGHPVSGMARERTASGNTVTTGGTGFGVMAMIVAAEHGFITKDEALQRIQKIVTFLNTKCTRYHGAFAHWIHGETGETIPFSTFDNGADLVETSLLFQGLLTARQYFSNSTLEETRLREEITRLWEDIDWTWFQKGGESVLYWHWSPEYEWQMNIKISGWNESLITYVMAASSPLHPISKETYLKGWARNGSMANNRSYFGYKLPLGPDLGGPLFFAHYSFMGLNPRGLKDLYADYWEQNRHHTLINYSYCKDNPKKYSGYSEHCWGLTASDGNQGYSAHSPTNDLGVIAPTAALASMPYTPEESMRALRFFYYKLGDKLWKEYGFVDAFNLSGNWFDNQHIAINQGPAVVMIENYRTGLLWKLFMSSPEIKAGLTNLGFTFIAY